MLALVGMLIPLFVPFVLAAILITTKSKTRTFIYSPCDGNISTAVDGFDDIAPGATGDTEHAAGNHVFINCQNGEIQVLLAHMKKNSLVVTQDTLVKAGDPIGQVGNSGNTSEPHLHIHASKGGTPDKLISGVGLPILFNEKFLVRNDIVAD